jgi:predicted enzyme related to lactoylglutathione lyase
MSERDGFQDGVPCWVDVGEPDPEAAVDFYTQLFGWEAEDQMPPDSEGKYFGCRLRGRDVAAIGSQPEGAPPVPAWSTYVWVQSADDALAKVTDAGGSVVAEPFDVFEAGRMGVFSDPAGAVLSVWQPNQHRAAQLVNEPGAWSMSALNTPDPEGAKAFYGAVFGWEGDTMEMGGSEMTLFRLPGFVGGEPEQPVPRDLVATMAPTSGDDVLPHWSVDFWVADADATAEKATALGGKALAGPYDIPVPDVAMRQAVLADPQGAAFSVTKVGPPA